MAMRRMKQLLLKRGKSGLDIEMSRTLAVYGILSALAVLAFSGIFLYAKSRSLESEVQAVFTVLANRYVADKDYNKGWGADISASIVKQKELPDSAFNAAGDTLQIEGYDVLIVTGKHATALASVNSGNAVADATDIGITATERSAVIIVQGIDVDTCNKRIDITPDSNKLRPIEKDPNGEQTMKAVHCETDWKRTAIESIKTCPSLVGQSDAGQAMVVKSWSKTCNLLTDGSVLGKNEAREVLQRVNDRFGKLLPLKDGMLGQNQPDNPERQIEHEAGTVASDASLESGK